MSGRSRGRADLGRVDIYLHGFPGIAREQALDGLVRVFRLSPKQAAEMLDSLPRYVKFELEAVDAQRWIAALHRIGGRAEARAHRPEARRELAASEQRTHSATTVQFPDPALGATLVPDSVPDSVPDPVPDSVPDPVPDPVPAPDPAPVPDPDPLPAPARAERRRAARRPRPKPAEHSVPAPVPAPAPAPSPSSKLSPRQRATVITACAVVFVLCGGYVVHEVSDVLREPSEKERILRRLIPEDSGYFTRYDKPGFVTPVPAPDVSCSDAARPLLRRAEQLGMEWDLAGAVAPAEQALKIDPDCVPAANILMLAHSKRGTHITLRNRFVKRADAEPANAAAQLEAAYYHREAGNPAEVREYLERATKRRPTQPLLDLAWGHYYNVLADPREPGRSLEHYEREVAQTGSLAALNNLIMTYGAIGELERTKQYCDRFYAKFPDSTLFTYAPCLWAVLRSGDRAAEKVYLERFWQARDLVKPCRHGSLASKYAAIEGRLDDALLHADESLEFGCPSYGAWPKVDVLIKLGRYDAAATLASTAPMRGNYDRFVYAMALALAGDLDAARRVAAGSMKTRHPAGGTTKEENLANLHVLRELLRRNSPREVLEAAYRGDGPIRPGDRAGEAACGYLEHGMFAQGAQAVERALALDEKSVAAWTCKVFSLTLEERHEEAAAAGERAVALGVTGSRLENNIGFAYRKLGDCERAIPHFERATRIAPTAVRAYGNLAECLEEVGRDDEAAAARRFVMYPTVERIAWQWIAGLVLAAFAVYLGAKYALIRLLPARFGHLKFP